LILPNSEHIDGNPLNNTRANLRVKGSSMSTKRRKNDVSCH
jgi:hypothetical protein